MSKYLTKECKRCEGKGRLAHFGHVNNGVCLDCKGSGFKYVTKKANFASVLLRSRMENGFSGWTVFQSGWVKSEETKESLLEKYITLNYDKDLIHINIEVKDRKVLK
jgi:hypothetical protein